MAILGLGEGRLPSIDIVQVVNDKVDQFLKRHGAIWKSRKESLNPTRILFATNIAGNSDAAALDRFLAIGSSLRGNRAGFVLCNANLDACQIVKYHNAEPSAHVSTTFTVPRQS
jgi:hypothetical protein